jgi:hypothetical protein
VRCRDRVARFTDVFCTPIEVRWILALVLAHAGYADASERAYVSARRALLLDAARLTGSRRASYCDVQPMHRAILQRRLDLPPGWTFAHPDQPDGT